MDPLGEKYYSWSGYNYVMDNSIRHIDPMGDTVRIIGSNGTSYDWIPGMTYDGDDEFISQAVSALNFMTVAPSVTSFTFYTRDREVVQGNAVLDFVEKGNLASSLIVIKEGAAGRSRHESGVIYWNSTEGIRMESLTMGVLSSVPPMAILLHEMGHAWLEETYGDNQISKLFWDEEQMIIDKLESKASLLLGFGRRDNHFNVRSSRNEALNQDFTFK